MRSIIIFSVLFLWLCAPALGRQQAASRFGVLELRRGGEDGREYRLLLDGRELLASGAESIEILKVLNGRGRDFVIVATYSGGIACPARLNIVEVFQSGRHRVSEEFGSCSDVVEAKVFKDRVTVEMPDYVPHPELLSRRELRRRRRTNEVYTWHMGKLSRRTVTR